MFSTIPTEIMMYILTFISGNIRTLRKLRLSCRWMNTFIASHKIPNLVFDISSFIVHKKEWSEPVDVFATARSCMLALKAFRFTNVVFKGNIYYLLEYLLGLEPIRKLLREAESMGEIKCNE